MDIEDLQIKSEVLLSKEPKLRVLNVADKLGVKERDLVQADCCGIESTYLGDDFRAVYRRLPELGKILSLTRNPWCVHERKGAYETLKVGKAGPVAIALGKDIDLRIFFKNWSTVWYVEQNGRRSIQFFDKAGVAIQKIYALEESNTEALQAIVDEFKQDKSQVPALEPIAKEVHDSDLPAQLREEWLAMKDTHDFGPLLKKWNVPRLSIYEAAGSDLAQQISVDNIEQMLNQVVQQQIPLMVFVGNSGLVQIHSGVIHKLMRTGSWFNILDPDFNLHLNTEAISQVWVVNKPTEDGWVTSMEAYAKNGELIAQFFGVRKPGVPELSAWRNLLCSYVKEPLAA
ncbi:hemin-degrading factor [Brackiella oedipodis]|uniref:hemin-degrading factor n=1 Tax=Brackiella oedipodis TaxID=124225 RepID=UPI00056DEBED|nr:hemin-degrading factor [Brackiella oedipodis]